MKGNRTSLNVYTYLLFPFLFFTPILISANSCSLVSLLLSLTSAYPTFILRALRKLQVSVSCVVPGAGILALFPLSLQMKSRATGNFLLHGPLPPTRSVFSRLASRYGGRGQDRVGESLTQRKGKFIKANSINSHYWLQVFIPGLSPGAYSGRQPSHTPPTRFPNTQNVG